MFDPWLNQSGAPASEGNSRSVSWRVTPQNLEYPRPLGVALLAIAVLLLAAAAEWWLVPTSFDNQNIVPADRPPLNLVALEIWLALIVGVGLWELQRWGWLCALIGFAQGLLLCGAWTLAGDAGWPGLTPALVCAAGLIYLALPGVSRSFRAPPREQAELLITRPFSVTLVMTRLLMELLAALPALLAPMLLFDRVSGYTLENAWAGVLLTFGIPVVIGLATLGLWRMRGYGFVLALLVFGFKLLADLPALSGPIVSAADYTAVALDLILLVCLLRPRIVRIFFPH